jgi:hypothetical protein
MIARMLASWKIGDSLAVATSIRDRKTRVLSDSERSAVKRWLPALRYMCKDHRPYASRGGNSLIIISENDIAGLSEIESIERDVQDSSAETRNLVMSRAQDTDYFPPVPDGQTLYPFQRAGVEYALKVLGIIK